MTIVVQSLCGSLDAEAIVVKESNVCGSDRVYQQQFFESVMPSSAILPDVIILRALEIQ